MSRDLIISIVLAVAALVLQIVLAPYISIGNIVPNFMLAFVLALAPARALRPNYLLVFVLGLAYDLLGSGPVGGMALLFVLTTLAVSFAMRIVDADTLIVPVVVVFVCAFVVNVIYGVLMVGVSDISMFDAFVYRSLPCGLYDGIIGLVLLPLTLRFCRAEMR